MTAAVLFLAALMGFGAFWTPDKSRADLEAKYAGASSEFVDVQGVRMHVRDTQPQASPDTPVLVLLHGFASSLHTWDDWVPALSKNWRVIRLDLPGCGLTGPEPTNDYSDERSVKLVVALMEQRGVQHATFVGHSMGGRLAWRLAADQPRRVDRLVLLAPDGFASPGFEYDRKPELPAAIRLLPSVLPRWMLRKALEPAFGNPQALSEELLTRYHDMLLAPGVRRAVIARMEQLRPRDPTPLLQTITTQTLLIWGDKDGMIPPANAQDYQRALRYSRLVMLPGVGHVPQEESPTTALQSVQAFLSE